ncbi:ZirS family two-partner secretion-like system exoprotein, partial [Salmonella enterica subsp. enterica serovar Kentucky]|nr:ZirS family two-partner secretion-like system exoprotein [Salmonella enterica subsp. enterica serovar Kentucky]
RYNTLGGVCLNVGCIPSKALLHVAKVIEEAKALAEHGIVFGEWDYGPLKKENVPGKYTQVITYRGHSNERIDISFKYAMSFTKE